MEISLLLMQQIAELFLMILMGYVIVKAGLLKGEDSKVISKIVLYLIIPCVIINAFQVDYTSEKVQGLLLAFAASVMLQVLLLIIVWGAGRLMGLNEVEKASVYYSNAGNLIMPIVTFVLGQEWVLYGCVFMSVQIVFVWSHGKWVLSRQSKIDWKKILLNINMVAVFAGVFLFFTKIRLPQILNQTFGSVGSMIGPASMMVTGMLIAEMSLKDIFTNGRVYFITFLRLIAVPAVALLLLKVSGLVNGSPDGKKLLLIVFLAVITPSASTITQMSQVYGNDSQYASAINVMTTLFSIVTMPLMVLLFQMLLLQNEKTRYWGYLVFSYIHYVYKGGIKCLCERGRALSVFSCLRCLLYIRYIVKTIVMCVKNIANRTNFDTMDTRGKRLEIRCKPVCRRIFEPGTRYHAIKRGRSCIRKTVLKQVRWCMPIPAVMRRIWSIRCTATTVMRSITW